MPAVRVFFRGEPCRLLDRQSALLPLATVMFVCLFVFFTKKEILYHVKKKPFKAMSVSWRSMLPLLHCRSWLPQDEIITTASHGNKYMVRCSNSVSAGTHYCTWYCILHTFLFIWLIAVKDADEASRRQMWNPSNQLPSLLENVH